MKKLLSSLLLVVLLVSVFLTALAEPDYVYTHGSVNLRKSASIDSKVVKVLSDGTECEVLSSKKDDRDIKWYKVTVGTKTGWVSSVYANDTPSTGTIKGYLTATGNVNLRKSANGKPILDVIQKGDTVAYFKSKTVSGKKWYLVRYSGTIGWASASYFKTKGGSSSSSTYKIKATGGSSYIRSAASTSAEIVGLLSKGNSASYLDASKKDSRGVTWYKVKYNDVTGWISSKFTKKVK